MTCVTTYNVILNVVAIISKYPCSLRVGPLIYHITNGNA